MVCIAYIMRMPLAECLRDPVGESWFQSQNAFEGTERNDQSRVPDLLKLCQNSP